MAPPDSSRSATAGRSPEAPSQLREGRSSRSTSLPTPNVSPSSTSQSLAISTSCPSFQAAPRRCSALPQHRSGAATTVPGLGLRYAVAARSNVFGLGASRLPEKRTRPTCRNREQTPQKPSESTSEEDQPAKFPKVITPQAASLPNQPGSAMSIVKSDH